MLSAGLVFMLIGMLTQAFAPVWPVAMVGFAFVCLGQSICFPNLSALISHSAPRERQGENLFMGTRGAYDYREMADAWIDERASFRGGTFPEVSATGDWSDVGHYTQIVWPETRAVGCALASNANEDYLVCRYLPAGNVVGTRLR